MGLLKNIVTKAVSDGISKGVGNAIGKAVEQAVRPAADKMAAKGAEALNNAAEEMNKGLEETKAAAAEARTATARAAADSREAVEQMGGFAGLEAALSGWAASAEKYAARAAANIKICPSCGEGTTADKTFCPHCGAKLPETTLGQDYTCTKCGAANTPGTKFCASCGALLPGAEAEVREQQAKDEAVLADFHAMLPQYPEWTCGGREFEFAERGTRNGGPEFYLTFQGTQKELDAYLAKLTEAGFNKKDQEYWKTVDGVCRTALAEMGDAGPFVLFYVSNLDKPAPKPADPVADLKGMAKGMFRKILG